jgi:hypothetical protein
VIAEGRVEVDLGIEQSLVGRFELVHEVLGTLGTIQVVPHHDDEAEGELLVRGSQLPPDVVLRRFTSAVVPDDGEAHGVWRQGKRQFLGREPGEPAARDRGERDELLTDRSRHLCLLEPFSDPRCAGLSAPRTRPREGRATCD